MSRSILTTNCGRNLRAVSVIRRSGLTQDHTSVISRDFGKTKLRHVNYSRIVLFLKSLAKEKGLGINTIGKINLILSMILEVAVKDGVLRTNPCRGAMKELQREHADEINKSEP